MRGGNPRWVAVWTVAAFVLGSGAAGAQDRDDHMPAVEAAVREVCVCVHAK